MAFTFTTHDVRGRLGADAADSYPGARERGASSPGVEPDVFDDDDVHSSEPELLTDDDDDASDEVDGDRPRLRHMPEGLFPTLPTNGRYPARPAQAAAAVPSVFPPGVSGGPAVVTPEIRTELAQASQSYLVANDPRPMLMALAKLMSVPAAPEQPPGRSADLRETTTDREALDRKALRIVRRGPSRRVMELQYFLTYLYQQATNASFIPDSAVSWTSNEILVNNEYYGSIIAAYETFSLFAGRDTLPSIEQICRNRHSVLFRPFVIMCAAEVKSKRVQSREYVTAKNGITVRGNAATRDYKEAWSLMRAALDAYFGRQRDDWEMALLQPSLY